MVEVIGDDAGASQANLSLPLDAMVRSAAPSATPAIQKRLATAFREQYDADLLEDGGDSTLKLRSR